MLRIVAEHTFAPKGPGYQPRVLLLRPERALRGGANGIAVTFAMRDGELVVRVLTNGELTREDVDEAITRARALAAVDDDPSDFFSMVREHPVLARLSRTFDPRLARTPTVFEAFAEAVIAQLVTSDEARISFRKLNQVAGELIEGTRLRAAATARAVLEVPGWKMHTIGIGSRRAKTLRDGASRGLTLERIASEPPETFIEKLMSMPGVGVWTANRVARHALGYGDAVPVGDLHAPSVVTEMLGDGAAFRDDEAMLRVLEPFRPHRARVMYVLERAHIAPTAFGGVGRRSRRPRVDPHRREPWKY